MRKNLYLKVTFKTHGILVSILFKSKLRVKIKLLEIFIKKKRNLLEKQQYLNEMPNIINAIRSLKKRELKYISQ